MLYHNHATLQRNIAATLIEISKEFIKIDGSKKIADIGSGSGFIAEHLLKIGAKRSNILQLDKNPEMLEFGQKFGRTQICDFDYELNIGERFDIAFSSMSLQWSRDINYTISNVKKILTDDAIFIFAVPIAGSLQELYRILGREFMIFQNDTAINAKLLHRATYTQNSYRVLNDIHYLNLKTSGGYKITKDTIKTLKKQDTCWNIGYFIC